MRSLRLCAAAVALVAAAVAVSACANEVQVTDTPATTTAPAPTSAATTAPEAPATGDEAAVTAVFTGYYQALLARDFATACTLNAPETNTSLLEQLAAQGTQVATCEEAYTVIYAQPGTAEVADEIARTAQIQDVAVDGDNATVTWSATSQGQQPTVTNGLRRIDGQWRLLDVG